MRSALPFAALLIVGCSIVDHAAVPPKFDITLSESANHELQHKKFNVGDRLDSFWHGSAEFPRHVITGQWQSPDFQTFSSSGTYYGSAKRRHWKITVDRGVTIKTSDAIADAKDAYAAKLGVLPGSGAYIMPRFERKTFSWGKAVSFLVQYQNDNTTYVPNNGMLMYEIHGVTFDGRFTVMGRFGVTHPRLTEKEPRDYRDGDSADPNSPVRQDPHYKLVEICGVGEFQPGLDEIDRMIDSIQNIR